MVFCLFGLVWLAFLLVFLCGFFVYLFVLVVIILFGNKQVFDFWTEILSLFQALGKTQSEVQW